MTLLKQTAPFFLQESYKYPLETVTLSVKMHRFFIFVDGENYTSSLTIEK